MMRILLIFVLAVLLGHSFAYDYSQHCPTMIAIYGICSPELVKNFLAHTEHTAIKPPIRKVNVEKLPEPQLANENLANEPSVHPEGGSEAPIIGQYYEGKGWWGGPSGWWATRPPWV